MIPDDFDRRIDDALLLAAYFRGGAPTDVPKTSNSDQIITLSLFFTGELTAEECAARFAVRCYVQQLYGEDGELLEMISLRYGSLIDLLHRRPDLIKGGGDLARPADPTFTGCWLTPAGLVAASALANTFPPKPEFPNWRDRRPSPAR